MNRIKILLMAALAVLLLAGCKKDKPALNVSPSQVEGLWQKSGTNEYWHYLSDGTGNTWDSSDGIHEGDSGSFHYTWYIVDGDLLTHSMEMISNPYVRPTVRYTILSISSSTMTWDEGTSESTLVKVGNK